MVYSKNRDYTLLNVIFTVILQIITLLSGFVIPRLIMETFGSEINGLVTSITQFLSYISLLEGGIGSVILANLYKPLSNKDNQKVSAVIITASNFFKKLAIFFIIYQLLLALIYPFFVKTDLGWTYISSLIVILGLSTFIQYYFALSWRLLLQADKKMFVSAFVQGIAVVLNLLITIIMIKIIPNIHVIKIFSGIAFFSQPLILKRYISKHYSINMDSVPDQELLKQRWDGFGINIASMIHSSTSTIILTLMIGLESVSVFSVYFLVVNGLKSLITAISAGLVPTIGNFFAKEDMDNCNRLFDVYDFIMFLVSFLCFTVGGITITTFVMLYTSNVMDANYYQPLLGGVLMITECIFCIRDPYVNMAYSAGHFRQVSWYAYGEAIINIILSILFTKLWGMNGVAFGMLISVTYRTYMQVYYLKKNILHRSIIKFMKKGIAFGTASIVCIFLVELICNMNVVSISGWISYAVQVTIIELCCLIIASIFVCKKEWEIILQFLRY